MENKGRFVSNEEIEVSFSVPTVNVNKFLVTSTPDKFRIAFGESAFTDSPVNYRIAVGLTVWEAYELREVLGTLLEPFQNQINELKAASGDGEATE